MKKIITPLLFILTPMVLTACSNSASEKAASKDNPVYTLILNPCVGSKDNYLYVKGHKGDKITLADYTPSVNKSGYSFGGWSYQYSEGLKMGVGGEAIQETYTFTANNYVLYGYYKKNSSEQSADSKAYMDGLKTTSQANHLYYHYYRFDNNAAAYAPWDVWAWSNKPTAGEGVKFDWVGRTQSADKKSATGDATIGELGGAWVDIDLKAKYDGGWDNEAGTLGGTEVSFATTETIGLQIVQSATRQGGGGKFWTNDGSNLFIKLADYALELSGGGTAYHVFVVQDDVQNPSAYPIEDVNNPFADDDGTNVTYGDNRYNNVAWGTSATTGLSTSAEFKEIGAGYQIMVSSFADSDGDGFGDIYGITQKLGYLEKLGVKALWLTPIQLSDSYHGYDITDYETVDPKFGSKQSPAGLQAGDVTAETALADYKELISEAHKKGMKVVMDLVLNHTSTSNKWFISSANLDDEYRGYYQWGNHETNPTKINQNNNWYPYGDHPYSYYAKFGSSMPELNFSYKSTREAVEEMSVYWAKTIGVDGFRLDAVKHIYMENEVVSTSGDTIVLDKSASGDYSSDLTKNIHFFKELKSVVTQQSGKNVFFVGENFDGHAYHVAPYYEAFDSLFDFYSYFNLTSGAATGRTNTASAFGTVKGFMVNPSLYQVSADNDANSGVKDNGGMFTKANGSAWNFVSVYNTYNKYRNDTSMPGLFTSNHDIARVINRIAGGGTAEGLQYQGNLTTSNYASYEQSADCVKIAELMMPGLTWVYYGDEIGMTGNFPSSYNPADVANIPYADLWYRQPMKWVQNGTKGDSAGTTDYYVTGSAMKVEMDAVNKSDKVKGALEQAESSTSEFAIMKKFIDLKNGNNNVGKALRYGAIKAEEWVDGELCSNVLTFSRTGNGVTIKVVVNFNAAGLGSNLTLRSGALSGTVLASYGGATQTSLPGYSAIVIQA